MLTAGRQSITRCWIVMVPATEVYCGTHGPLKHLIQKLLEAAYLADLCRSLRLSQLGSPNLPV